VCDYAAKARQQYRAEGAPFGDDDAGLVLCGKESGHHGVAGDTRKEGQLMEAPRILLVDDNDMVRTMLTRILINLYPKACITSVDDGMEALTHCATEAFDVLIVDGRMTPLSGVDLIRTVRANGLTCPIVLMSMDTSLQAAVEEVGANAFLAKPFMIKELDELLTILLPRSAGK
jgi:DNA-binding response OmpR family regulator